MSGSKVLSQRPLWQVILPRRLRPQTTEIPYPKGKNYDLQRVGRHPEGKAESYPTGRAFRYPAVGFSGEGGDNYHAKLVPSLDYAGGRI